MTLLEEREAASHGADEGSHDHDYGDHGHHAGPRGILLWMTSTDHKIIGLNYMITSLVMFFIAGSLALLIRIQLSSPQNSFLSFQTYNELFTMHGSLMMYLFAGPFAFGGLANFIIPLQVGAPDMAFPRLNAFSYWLYLGGSFSMLLGFFTAGGAAAFGWVAYAPLSNSVNSPGAGADLWIVALGLTGFSAIFTGVNLVTTIFYLRAPGMTMFRMPIFTWNMLVTALLILIAFPVLFAAMVLLWADRHFGAHIFDDPSVGGSPILYQNLFWFFGHPEVYILALPYFGMVTEIIPAFSRKPLFGYKGMVFATMAIAALSTGVWAHHMFTTGTVLLPFFSLLSFFIAVPTGIKFFNWIGTMWGGQISLQDTDVVLHRVPLRLLDGRRYRRHARLATRRLRDPRHLLRGRTLPPGADRDRRLRRVRRALLLVPEDVRPDAEREARRPAFLVPLRRLLDHDHPAVHPRARGDAPARRHLPCEPRLAVAQHPRQHRRLDDRALVPVHVLEHRAIDMGQEDREGSRQPLGRRRSRMVHLVTPGPPQLREAPTDPLRATCLGLLPPGAHLDRPPCRATCEAAGRRSVRVPQGIVINP